MFNVNEKATVIDRESRHFGQVGTIIGRGTDTRTLLFDGDSAGYLYGLTQLQRVLPPHIANDSDMDPETVPVNSVSVDRTGEDSFRVRFNTDGEPITMEANGRLLNELVEAIELELAVPFGMAPTFADMEYPGEVEPSWDNDGRLASGFQH